MVLYSVKVMAKNEALSPQIYVPLFVHKDLDFKNLRVKCTPSGEPLEILIANKRIFNPGFDTELYVRDTLQQFDLRLDGKIYSKPKKVVSSVPNEKEKEENAKRSRNRAKQKLFDYASCNYFDCFFTLTLNAEKIDRYSYKDIIHKLNAYLDNRVRRNGLMYVIVPELHKDGAIHFHGLCNSSAVKLSDSGHKDKKGRKVYNITDWTLGFTTAVKINGRYGAVCNYISKYITKQYEGNLGTLGGRYFFHGGKLQKPVYRYYNIVFEDIPEDVLSNTRSFFIDDAHTDFLMSRDDRIMPRLLDSLSKYCNL